MPAAAGPSARVVADLVIHGAKQVVTCRGPAPRAGSRQGDAGAIAGGAIAALGGRIVFVGAAADCDRLVAPLAGARVIDASGATVLPGFVDPHTHVIFAGDRREELRRRLAGASYAEIAASGGGIVATVAATRQATEASLAVQSRARVDAMLRCGTTTAEAKSGYGLEIETELKMLRVIRRLNAEQPVELVPTFLGAHEIPLEHRADRRRYIAALVEEMIPAAAAPTAVAPAVEETGAAGRPLAEWCDVFCEDGVYTPEESREILEAGARAGLKPRIHADELALSGGSEVAAAVGARSADHLLYVDRAAVAKLRQAGVVATLLPIAAFYLKLGRFAPARLLIDEGVPVALATDLNPGGGFSPSMPFAVTLGCFAMGMTLEEALVAATLNAAFALDRHDRLGSLEVGKEMDAVVLRGDAIDLVRVGADLVETVIKNGKVVVAR